MDGYLKIKTKIDNKDVDKGIVELEDKIKKVQIDNSDLSKQQDELQTIINQYNELNQRVNEYKRQMQSLQYIDNKGNVQVTDKNKMLNLQAMYSITNSELEKQAIKIDNIYDKLNKVKAKQTENNAKIQQYKEKIEQINLKKVQNGIDNVGKGLQNSIGKLAKMSMAVIGVRTALSAVTRVVNMVKQNNEQISTDFQYMGYCIANVVAPAVQKLVQLLYKALSYINAITSAWFGINLFGNSSVKNFEKMQKGASSTAKSAKEIQKSLQGFDEMNILQDNSKASDSTENVLPSMDLSNMQGEVPQWLQWIIDNKDLIISTLSGIATGILSIKLGVKGIESLGIGVLIAGIIELIQSIIAYINEPSWENFGKVVSSLGVIIAGIGIIIASVLGIAAGAPVIITGIIVAIVGVIVANWEKIKQFLQNGMDWLANKSDWIHRMFGDKIGAIYDLFVGTLQQLLNMFDGIFKGVKTILDGILKVFKGIFNGDMKTVLDGFKQIFKGVFDTLWSIAKVPLNLIINGINSLIKGANKIKFDVPDWVPGFGGKTFGFKIQQIPLLAKGGVISQPTQAIIGEAGTEAVMPLENNLEWLDILADKLASKIGNSGSSYIIQMDSRTIQRGFAKRQQELSFATNGR